MRMLAHGGNLIILWLAGDHVSLSPSAVYDLRCSRISFLCCVQAFRRMFRPGNASSSGGTINPQFYRPLLSAPRFNYMLSLGKMARLRCKLGYVELSYEMNSGESQWYTPTFLGVVSEDEANSALPQVYCFISNRTASFPAPSFSLIYFFRIFLNPLPLISLWFPTLDRANRIQSCWLTALPGATAKLTTPQGLYCIICVLRSSLGGKFP